MGFLNRERLTVYPILFLSIYLLSMGVAVGLGSGLLDVFGHPVGLDFLSYWAAGKAAVAGDPSAAYDLALHQRVSEAAAGASIRSNPWLYSPAFLLWMVPFATLSYLEALVLWTVLSITAYVAVMRGLLPGDRAAWLPALAFPAFVQNLIQGQNGCLTLALLGSGLLLMNRRPLLAGVSFGLLSYKPHLLPLAWVALVASRRWKVLACAVLTAMGLMLVSAAVLGIDSWRAFFRTARLAVFLLESGAAPLAKMSTVQSALLLAGAPLQIARGAQAAASLAALAAVWISWRRRDPLPISGCVLLLGTLLFTPYGAYDYDLVLLAPVIAWLALEGVERGWHSGEKPALVAAWLLPLVGPWIAFRTNLSIGPVVLLWLLAHAMMRASAEIRSEPLPQAA